MEKLLKGMMNYESFHLVCYMYKHKYRTICGRQKDRIDDLVFFHKKDSKCFSLAPKLVSRWKVGPIISYLGTKTAYLALAVSWHGARKHACWLLVHQTGEPAAVKGRVMVARRRNATGFTTPYVLADPPCVPCKGLTCASQNSNLASRRRRIKGRDWSTNLNPIQNRNSSWLSKRVCGHYVASTSNQN